MATKTHRVELPSPFIRRDHKQCLEVLEDAVKKVNSGERLKLDMQKLEILDSFAISKLLDAYRKLTAKEAMMKVINVSEQGIQTMQITGVWEILSRQKN